MVKHGGLAKVGKVKAQTPKVAETEKKKPLTGRAKKREQYHRRFALLANQPPGKGGRGRGPNCQQVGP
jgi:small subunit ribosomal protein S30e